MGKRKIQQLWPILKDLGESQKEMGRQFREFQGQLNQKINELGESQEEMARQMRDWQMRESQERRDRYLREVGQRIGKLRRTFISRWEETIEAMAYGNLAIALKERNINVDKVVRRFPSETNYKFDLLAVGGHEIVVIEVNKKLRPKEVKKFSTIVKTFRELCPLYKDKIVYAGMIYYSGDRGGGKRAMEKGFFVIEATDRIASIINDKDFKPRKF